MAENVNSYQNELYELLLKRARVLSYYGTECMEWAKLVFAVMLLWFLAMFLITLIVYTTPGKTDNDYLGQRIITPSVISRSGWFAQNGPSLTDLMNAKIVHGYLSIAKAGNAEIEMAEYILEYAIKRNVVDAPSIHPVIEILQNYARKNGRIPHIVPGSDKKLQDLLTAYLVNPKLGKQDSLKRMDQKRRNIKNIDNVFVNIWLWGSGIILSLSVVLVVIGLTLMGFGEVNRSKAVILYR